MISQMSHVFLKTAYNRLLYIGRDRPKQLSLKQDWAQSLLNKLNVHVTVLGTPPPKTPHVLVGNHISYLDIPLLMAALLNA